MFLDFFRISEKWIVWFIYIPQIDWVVTNSTINSFLTNVPILRSLKTVARDYKMETFARNESRYLGRVVTFWVINPLSASVALIETSQLICTANQLTGFYMRATLALNGLSRTEKLWLTRILSSNLGSNPVCCVCLRSRFWEPWQWAWLKIRLTHLFPMHPFSTPWKQKTSRFSVMFSGKRGGLHLEHMGLPNVSVNNYAKQFIIRVIIIFVRNWNK